MASSKNAEQRITRLLFNTGEYTSHPSTITFDDDNDTLYSYALPIAWKDGDGFWVKADRDSSLTSNRHVGALWFALEAMDYRKTDQTDDFPDVAVDRGGGTRYARWVKNSPDEQDAIQQRKEEEFAAYWASL